MALIIAIIFIALGGFASGSFYLPLKYVKKWKWESGWIVYSIFALLIGPWIMAFITLNGVSEVISGAQAPSIYWPIIFGAGWGVGGLTWGLSIRYLGIGLGNALPLGLTSALSTLIGPFVPIMINPGLRPNGFIEAVSAKMDKIFAGTPGALIIVSVIVSLVGIGICSWAASRKDKEQKGGQDELNKEFNLRKGLLVALVAGIMSACFAFGEYAGSELTVLSEKMNPGSIWQSNTVFAVLLIGGFIVNIIYCLIQSARNKSFKDFTSKQFPVSRYFLLASLAGILWFAQFVFKGIGTTSLPESMAFINWSLLFTFVIVFSNIIGLLTKEWKGVSKTTLAILFTGLLVLIISVGLVGYAAYLS